MSKFADALRHMKEVAELKDRIVELERKLRVQGYDLKDAERSLKFLADTMCRTSGFQRWLLEQDTSSMMTYRPPVGDTVRVEGRSNVDLACDYGQWLEKKLEPSARRG